MDTFLNTSIAIIIWLQGLGNWLVAPMKFFTFLGSEEFFLVLLPLVYWCIDTNAGLRIGVIVLFTGGVNDILKLTFHGPRPYWISTQVKALAAEPSFGVPSGHAQIATGLWGMAAAQIRRRWAWWGAAFLIFIIGISRLYLAVHFLHDVLLGWVIGAVVLWAFLRWWNIIAAWVKKKSLGQQIGLALALSVVMLVFGSIAYGPLRGWVLPAEWTANALQNGAEAAPAPVTLNVTITSAAVLFGLLAGLAWMNARSEYNASGTLLQRFARFLIGMAGVLILYFGLRAIFPAGNSFLPYLLRYVRYALTGLWISAGAPWLFQRLNLAKVKV